jgi:hypothetical protein
LNVQELKSWIVESFGGLGIHLDSEESDFFAFGVDSLKAIQMRGLIIKNLYLVGRASKCHSMIVYNTGTVERLAKTLYSYQIGQEEKDGSTDEVEELSALTKQYSVFNRPSWETEKSLESSVVVSSCYPFNRT